MPVAVRLLRTYYVHTKGELCLSGLLGYSMQLAMLKQLLKKELVTEKEYSLLKLRLMEDYKILSNLTAFEEKNH